jgi:hypothetical protein
MQCSDFSKTPRQAALCAYPCPWMGPILKSCQRIVNPVSPIPTPVQLIPVLVI